MNNMGVHAYDLLRYLFGAEVIEATAVVDVEEGLGRRHHGAGPAPVRQRRARLRQRQPVGAEQPADLSIYGTEGTVLGRGITRPEPVGALLGDRTQRHHRARPSPRPGPSSRRSPTSPTRYCRGATPAPPVSTGSGACSSPTRWRGRYANSGPSGWTAEAGAARPHVREARVPDQGTRASRTASRRSPARGVRGDGMTGTSRYDACVAAGVHRDVPPKTSGGRSVGRRGGTARNPSAGTSRSSHCSRAPAVLVVACRARSARCR